MRGWTRKDRGTHPWDKPLPWFVRWWWSTKVLLEAQSLAEPEALDLVPVERLPPEEARNMADWGARDRHLSRIGAGRLDR